MRVVYADVLFAINLSINYLILLLTANCCTVYVSRWRILGGAAWGALFSVLFYFPQLPTVAAIGIKLLLCFVITATVFGKEARDRFFRLAATFAAVSFALAGGVTAIAYFAGGNGISVSNGIPYFNISLQFLLAAVLIIYLILRLVFRSGSLNIQRNTAQVCLQNGEKSLLLQAFLDSGNLLREPISGKWVILVSNQEAAKLFDGETRQLVQQLQRENMLEIFQRLVLQQVGKFRLAPYRDAASGSGMILIVKLDSITVNKKETDQYILGISPIQIETADGCRAIMGV